MASPSQDTPSATTETPYRDDPDAVESSPPLVGEQAAPGDEEQGIAAPTSEDATSPDPPHRQFNFIRFHLITFILATIVGGGILTFAIVYTVVGYPLGYHLPWYFDRTLSGIITCCFFSIAWAGLSLFRHRKRERPLPMSVSTILHGCLAFFLAPPALQLIGELDYSPPSSCWGSGGDRAKCEVFAYVAWSFLIVYVTLLLVIALLQCIQFVACLTTAYRRRTWSRGSEHGVTLPGGYFLPGGQVSIEFSVRFLRQDLPPPAPVRGVAPAPPRPVSPPPLISTE